MEARDVVFFDCFDHKREQRWYFKVMLSENSVARLIDFLHDNKCSDLRPCGEYYWNHILRSKTCSFYLTKNFGEVFDIEGETQLDEHIALICNQFKFEEYGEKESNLQRQAEICAY